MSHYKPYPAYKDSGVEWLGILFGLLCLAANVPAALLGRHINREHRLSPLVVTWASMGVGSGLMLITGLALLTVFYGTAITALVGTIVHIANGEFDAGWRRTTAIGIGVLDGKVHFFERFLVKLILPGEIAAFQRAVDPIRSLFVGPPGGVGAFGIIILRSPEFIAIRIA